VATWASRALVLCLGGGICFVPVCADDQPNQYALIREAPAGASLVQPGATVRLQVRVANAGGNTEGGVRVLFAAPKDGPSGSFKNGGGTLAIVSADEDGIAAVEFAVGTEAGPILLSAKPERSALSVEWALTVAPAPPFSEGEAGAALSALQDQLKAQADDTKYLGPFLVPAGSTLFGAGQHGDFRLEMEVVETSWFVLIDDAPEAAYSHKVRYALVPADRPGGPWVVTEHGFWPIVRWSSTGLNHSLRSPGDTRGASVPPEEAAQAAKWRGDRSADEQPNACAIVIYGSDELAPSGSAAAWRSLFLDTVKLPADRVLFDADESGSPRPTTISRLRELVAKAKEKGCAKLYFVFVGHAGFLPATLDPADTRGFVMMENESLEDQNPNFDGLSYETLAKSLKESGSSEYCVVIDACTSGRAVRAFQNLGMSGLIVTGSDRAEQVLTKRYVFTGWHQFSDGLVREWKGLADIPGPEVTLQEAFARLLRDGSEKELKGKPQIARIDPEGGKFDAPPVMIESPTANGANTVRVTVPKPVDLSGDSTVRLTIADPGVAVTTTDSQAAEPGLAIKVIRENSTSITFELTGLKDGETTYTLRSEDNNRKVFQGTGIITVGTGIYVTPNPAVIDRPGASVDLELRRTGSGGPAMQNTLYQITPADAATAELIENPPTGVVIQQGASSAPFQLKGATAGQGSLTVANGSQRTSFRVLTSGVRMKPSLISLFVGEKFFTTLERFGALTLTRQIFVVRAVGDGASIARITPAQPILEIGQAGAQYGVEALKAGSAEFIVVDPLLPYAAARFRVDVRERVAGCLYGAMIDMVFTVTSDLAVHHPFFGIQRVLVTYFNRLVNNAYQATIGGDQANVIQGAGSLNTTTCGFTAEARGTVVGMPGVRCQWRNPLWTPGSNSFSVEYGCGLNGELPMGQPIWYRGSGTIRSGSAVTTPPR
jgi:hypothetical protein